MPSWSFPAFKACLTAFGCTLHHDELVVGALDAYRVVKFVHQTRAKLCNKRNDRIQPFLQMLFGKHKAVERPGVAACLFVPDHHLFRRLARYLAYLILDLPPARRKSPGKGDIEMAQI